MARLLFGLACLTAAALVLAVLTAPWLDGGSGAARLGARRRPVRPRRRPAPHQPGRRRRTGRLGLRLLPTGPSALTSHPSAAVFDWLFEGHLSVYVLLAAAAILCVVVWVRTRKRRWLALAAIFVALAGLYCLLDLAVETDREQIARKVNAMAAGLKAPADLDAAFQNVSDRFQCPFADGKTALREKAPQQIQTWHITEVRISDLRGGRGFAREEHGRRRLPRQGHRLVRPTGSGDGPLHGDVRLRRGARLADARPGREGRAAAPGRPAAVRRVNGHKGIAWRRNCGNG